MQPVISESPSTLTGWSPRVTSLREAQFGSQQTSLLALIGAIAALALIACANLANLTLAQAASRRAEWALRAALGGGRAAILRLQMVETSLLAATGVHRRPAPGRWDPAGAPRPRSDNRADVWRCRNRLARAGSDGSSDRDGRPALRRPPSAAPAARQRGRRHRRRQPPRDSMSRRDLQARQWLVGAECAAAVVLLASGAVLVSAFDGSTRIEFRASIRRTVPGAQMRVSASAYPTEARRAEFITRVLDRVRTIPGVVAAASTLNSFTPGNAFVTLIDIEGQPTADGQQHTVQFRRVSRLLLRHDAHSIAARPRLQRERSTRQPGSSDREPAACRTVLAGTLFDRPGGSAWSGPAVSSR